MNLESSRSNRLSSRLFTNPIIRRLNQVTDTSLGDQNCATYLGIGSKTAFFLLLTVIGFVTYLLLAPSQISSDGSPSQTMLIILIAASLFTIFMPILSWRFRSIIPIIGSLYAISQGFLIPFIANSYAADFWNVIYLALIITLIIILVMYVLYAKKIIRVTEKFRSVLFTLLFTSILTSIFVFILSLFPATSEIVSVIYTNPIVSIVGSVAMIIIAALFLLTDFAAIDHTVSDRLPKEYEWYAAFGLTFTVLWLYLKVLTLIAKNDK